MKQTTQIAAVGKIRQNIMGTISISMKLKGMKAEDEFCVYPIGADGDAKVITIQSGKRFAKLDISTGKGTTTPSHANGAYGHHYTHAQIFNKLQDFQISQDDVNRIKMEIFGTTNQNAGNNGWIFSDNSGAVNVL